jgi:hypothetical protein
MTTQEHGSFSKLDPPVMVNGLLCGGVLRFNGGPSSSNSIPVVVSGVIERVVSLGGGLYEVTCKRGLQSSDILVTNGPGDTFQFIWQWKGGGTVVRTSEDMRGISHANARSIMGSDAGDRCQPRGDGFRLRQGSIMWPICKITDAESHAVSPIGGVSWWPDDPLPTNTYVEVELYEFDPNGELQIAGIPVGEFFFDPDEPSPLNGSSVRLDDGVTQTALTRKVFPLGDYPANASLDDDEYYLDDLTRDLRLSSGSDTYGANLVVFYWVKNIGGPYVVGANEVVALTAEGGLGYADGGDTLGLSGEDTLGDFDKSFVVTAAAAGSVEWRRDPTSDSDVLAVEWDVDGDVVVVAKRSGAVYSEPAFTPGTYAFPLTCRVVKSAGEITIRLNGTIVAQETLSGVVAETDGVLSMGTRGGIQFLRTEQAERQVIDFAGGTARFHAFKSDSSTAAVVREVTPLAGRTITAIVNEATGEAMSQSSTIRRDTYRISGGKYQFPAEANGDRIRITYAADDSSPSGTGRPPRVFQQVNFATAVSPATDPPTSTTAAGENKGNWHDKIVLRWEGSGPFPGEVGDSFDVVRWGVWDPDDPPSIHYDVKDDDETDWAAMSSDDFRGLWWEGVVFLGKDFLDDLAGEDVCWRATGIPQRNLGAFDAQLWNEQRLAMNWLDGGYLLGGIAGGGGSEGAYGVQFVGGITPACAADNSTFFFTEMAWGHSSDSIGTNYWDVTASNDIVRVNAPASHASGRPDVTCGVNDFPLVPWHIDGGVYSQAYPFGIGDPDFDISFGSRPFAVSGLANALDGMIAESTIVAAGFTPADWMSRSWEGAEVVSAKLEVRFDGLKTRTHSWSNHYDGSQSNVRDYLHVVNGVTVEEIVDGVDQIGEVVDPPADPAGGSVTFMLVAKRKNSKNIVLHDGAIVEAPAGELVSLGVMTGTATAVNDAEWHVIDVEDAVQALLDEGLDSEYAEFSLWPTTGGPVATPSTQGLSAYVESLMGSRSVSWTNDAAGEVEEVTITGSTKFTYATSINFGKLLVRVRQHGSEEDLVLPLRQPVFKRLGD